MTHLRVMFFLRYGLGVLVVSSYVSSGQGIIWTKVQCKKRINKYQSNFTPILHLLTFRRLHQFAYFIFTNSHRFEELHRFSATFDNPRVPCEYLLVVASRRIAVVRTKVLELSSLSINRSNRLARFGYRIGY
jgi:hypothetical protein